MADIDITRLSPGQFKVAVRSGVETEHDVTIPESYFQKLTGGAASHEELLRASFEFLLERESNTMILGQFDLPIIGRYFPEYEEEIRKVLAR